MPSANSSRLAIAVAHIDGFLQTTDAEATAVARRLAREEGGQCRMSLHVSRQHIADKLLLDAWRHCMDD